MPDRASALPAPGAKAPALTPRPQRNAQPVAPLAGPRLVVDREREAPGWDDFVASADGGHHAQSSLWAQVKSVLGWDATRLTVREGDAIVGGVQVLSRSVGPRARVGFAPRGPLVAGRNPRVLDLLHRALLDLGREERIRYLKVQPPADRHDLVPALTARGWTTSAMEAAPTATIAVDLSPTEDELLGAMRRSTRDKIRRSLRRGLRIRVGGERDFASYRRIVEATGRRQGFTPYPARYYETMWRVFGRSGRACLLLAELDDRVLSSTLLIALGDRATYKMGGWTGEQSRVRPNEAIHFAGMRWAKEAAYRYYDFDGIDRRVAVALSRDGDLAEGDRGGVAQFKLGFGGHVELTPGALDIAPERLLRPAVRLIAPRMDRFLAVAHRFLGRGA
jgi:lipid II:glycine glycyltransferase (peptidoglycan interpeptide bridge formation enzyme)